MRQGLRETVDLSGYPGLVMILLGFKLRRPGSIPVFFSLGRGFAEIARHPPEGLLGTHTCLFGWNHLGFRQYWRDMEALEHFTRTGPHGEWWKRFAQDQQGAGFWHEVYSARGGMEALYLGMPQRTGFGAFAPIVAPTGRFKTARGRIELDRERRAAEAG
jgi:hypothetical protein